MVELAGIIILGIAAQWIAWRLKVPAILPLILTGLLVGPLSTLWTADGQKVLLPIFDLENERGLFPGRSLFYFVSLSIGIILFEGGLTLKRDEVKDLGKTVLRLILLGSLITFVGAAIAAKLILPELSWQIVALFAALIIVTGPTVIAPILQNVPLNRNVSTVLKWEGILIDPIGALAAVLVFEFITTEHGSGAEFTLETFLQVLQVIINGTVLGVAAGYGLFWMIKKELIPHFLLNVFTLALVLAVFVLSDLLTHESGLVTVVVMGLVLGNLDVPRLKEILDFKESISVLLISILFIVLAANIEMKDLELLMDWRCLLLFGVVILVLRPLGVFLSTIGSGMNINERLFISWVGPRGIVAAGIASLFGLQLIEKNVPHAEYIVPLVFMIVLGTVLLNATTAKPLAKLLRITQDESRGILIVGANELALLLGKYFKDNGRHVVLVDSSSSNIRKAKEQGLESIRADIFTNDLTSEIDLVDVGYLLALTSSSEVNNYAVRKFRNVFGENGTFRLLSSSEMRLDTAAMPDSGVFSYRDDYFRFLEIMRDYPKLHEIEIKSTEHLHDLIATMGNDNTRAPVLLKQMNNTLDPIPIEPVEMELEEKVQLVYLGKELEPEEEQKIENLEV